MAIFVYTVLNFDDHETVFYKRLMTTAYSLKSSPMIVAKHFIQLIHGSWENCIENTRAVSNSNHSGGTIHPPSLHR